MDVWQTLIVTLGPVAILFAQWWIARQTRRELADITKKVDGMNSALQAKNDAQRVELDSAAKLDASKSAQIVQQDKVQSLTDAQQTRTE